MPSCHHDMVGHSLCVVAVLLEPGREQCFEPMLSARFRLLLLKFVLVHFGDIASSKEFRTQGRAFHLSPILLENVGQRFMHLLEMMQRQEIQDIHLSMCNVEEPFEILFQSWNTFLDEICCLLLKGSGWRAWHIPLADDARFMFIEMVSIASI